MKKLYFILLLLILTILPVFAAEWVEIAPKMYADKSSYNYNPKTKIAQIWIKALNSEDYKIDNINGKKVWYSLGHHEFNCSGKQILTLSVTHYDLQGKVLDSFENSRAKYESLRDKEYRNVVPDSIGEFWYEVACYP